MGCWQGMLPAALPPTAGPTVVISVLAKQQHQNALQRGVHQCARPLSDTHAERAWRMPEVVRECPQGVMIRSGFPSALEKVVESFAFQKKKKIIKSPFWHYAFLHPPRVVSELLSAAILTFTSPFCAASFPRTLCPRSSPDSSRGLLSRRSLDVQQQGGARRSLPPSSRTTQGLSALCQPEGTPQPRWGSHSCSPCCCCLPSSFGMCLRGWWLQQVGPASREGCGRIWACTGSQRGVSGTGGWRQGSACEPSQAGRLGSQKQSERHGFGSLCRLLP